MKALPFWPVERIEEILDLLQGGSVERTTFKAVMPSIVSPRDLEAWLYAAASSRGIEAEPINARGHELESVISGAAPAILVTFRSVLAVRRVRGQRVTLLVPEGGERTVDMQQVTLAICDLWQRRYDLPSIDPVLEAAQVPEARRARTKVAFLREQLAARPLEVGWAGHAKKRCLADLLARLIVFAGGGPRRRHAPLRRSRGVAAPSDGSESIAAAGSERPRWLYLPSVSSIVECLASVCMTLGATPARMSRVM